MKSSPSGPSRFASKYVTRFLYIAGLALIGIGGNNYLNSRDNKATKSELHEELTSAELIDIVNKTYIIGHSLAHGLQLYPPKLPWLNKLRWTTKDWLSVDGAELQSIDFEVLNNDESIETVIIYIWDNDLRDNDLHPRMDLMENCKYVFRKIIDLRQKIDKKVIIVWLAHPYPESSEPKRQEYATMMNDFLSKLSKTFDYAFIDDPIAKLPEGNVKEWDIHPNGRPAYTKLFYIVFNKIWH